MGPVVAGELEGTAKDRRLVDEDHVGIVFRVKLLRVRQARLMGTISLYCE